MRATASRSYSNCTMHLCACQAWIYRCAECTNSTVDAAAGERNIAGCSVG